MQWLVFCLIPQGRDSTPEALCNFKALAMDENQKYEGYDAAMYYTPEANAHSAQLIVSQVGANTNWKMCVDTSVDARPEAKVRVKRAGMMVTFQKIPGPSETSMIRMCKLSKSQV